ncbi:MAG: tRNA pseudouridine(55) synthase TruB [Peptococcaceae bacterium]|jgi:tRNA pseudouridine55 synthase|nr:tRNA pseudouridine(55) synthase TruB [Peptococcaceae bacterium]
MALEGILNILKPPGMTSHDVVSFARRALNERKIGHGGTLDPQAAGVLPVFLGPATRLADYLAGGYKAYYGEMRLGLETDTQDAWGQVTARLPVPALTEAAIRAATLALTGDIRQEAPAYSAVKIGGESLHRLARRGQPQVGLYRSVWVGQWDILGYTAETIRFQIVCGSGTYVRMLCRDLGRLLGSGGVMTFLLRTAVGPFALADSLTLEDVAERQAEIRGGGGGLAPKELALWGLPQVRTAAAEARRLRQGQTVWLPDEAFQPAATAVPGQPPGLGEKRRANPAPGQSPQAAVSQDGGLTAQPPQAGAGRGVGATGQPPQAGAGQGGGATGQSPQTPPGIRVAALDEAGRLAALGLWYPGFGARRGQGRLKPEKVFGD